MRIGIRDAALIVSCHEIVDLLNPRLAQCLRSVDRAFGQECKQLRHQLRRRLRHYRPVAYMQGPCTRIEKSPTQPGGYLSGSFVRRCGITGREYGPVRVQDTIVIGRFEELNVGP